VKVKLTAKDSPKEALTFRGRLLPLSNQQTLEALGPPDLLPTLPFKRCWGYIREPG
jgi:hypothetical protein